MDRRWTNVQALELHGPWISNACTHLQRLYPTLTHWQRLGATVPPRRIRGQLRLLALDHDPVVGAMEDHGLSGGQARIGDLAEP